MGMSRLSGSGLLFMPNIRMLTFGLSEKIVPDENSFMQPTGAVSNSCYGHTMCHLSTVWTK
jgi:hypothetical protein